MAGKATEGRVWTTDMSNACLMRILFAAHNAYTDNTSGAARSMRTIVEWLAAAGHECRAVGTSRFDALAPEDLGEHLESLGVKAERALAPACLRRFGKQTRPLLSFEMGGVPVLMLLTQHNDLRKPDMGEGGQLVELSHGLIKSWRPDIVLTVGAHPAVQEIMRRARELHARTVFSIRNYGYEDVRWFQHADAVLTCSPYLSRYYAESIGLASAGIPSPIDWADVVAEDDSRAFVTFVHPARHKGAAVFARLADMLGARRPDIPMLVVQSAADATELNSIPGIDFSRYPQIMAAPATPRPLDFLELTRILLVPSVFAEPFGRIAAEALINGIPPIVSDRGALQETVAGAGVVLPLPEWLRPETRTLPAEEELRPWFDAVCRLWDDQALYQSMSIFAKEIATKLYTREALEPQYLRFFDCQASLP